MTPELLDYEALLRLSAFGGALGLMALLEAGWPRRARRFGRLRRWPGNLALVLLNTLTVRLLFPAAAVGFALMTEESGVGLFNQLDAPRWIAVALTLLLLDLTIYAQHCLFHRVPALWHIHSAHHTDLDIDVTTGVRFHPIEILLSMLIKLAAILILGAPAIAVLIFEVVLNTMAMFNHANLNLPDPLDRALRTLVVTPDMHRVHHSVRVNETNSNYGFNLSCWDRLFRTYIATPADGHTKMTIGLPEYQQPTELRIDRILIRPFSNR
jgi:sterol desaturase/sphingolipid hydroxylase (fatty acid hydroxylase superfamily)